ncbi:MAG: Lacal_2735 family protein [Crocinitomicaceae bacterium]|nr:Lacal_2735 family protein [Crocinitomicaceae bacterium]
MFKLFRKKTEIDKLNAKYKSLLKESKNLSTSSRSASDAKLVEAESILNKIKALESKFNSK